MNPRPRSSSSELAERLGAAVDYLEARLGGEADLDQAARRSGFSRWHFMRLFQAAAGLPPAEYVRRRRLSRAAEALAQGQPVLAAAIDWGYESQATFTRAFSRTFGVTPAAWARRARSGGQPLELVFPFEPRLPFAITPVAPPHRAELAPFRLVGLGTRAAARRYRSFADIPTFWDDWLAHERWRAIDARPGAPGYGICREHASGEVEYVIGLEPSEGARVPHGYRAVEVAGGSCAVFSASGPPTSTIQALTLAAYGHWLPRSGARRRPGTWDVEVYRWDPSLPECNVRCEVWIPLVG